jgi:hypothetical protein
VQNPENPSEGPETGPTVLGGRFFNVLKMSKMDLRPSANDEVLTVGKVAEFSEVADECGDGLFHIA